MRYGQPRGTDCRKERLVERRLPLRIRGLQQIRPTGPANVVDEHIESAKGVDRLLDDTFNAVDGGDIGLNRGHKVRPLGRGLDFDRRLRQLLLAARAQAYAAALGDQGSRARQPKTTARAGNYRNFVGESKIHGVQWLRPRRRTTYFITVRGRRGSIH